MSSTEYYDISQGKFGKWELTGNMYIEREIFAFSVINNYIYVFGGFNETNLDTIEKFDRVNKTWEILNVIMPISLQNATAVTVNKKDIYVIGGSNGTFQNYMSIFDIETKLWSQSDFQLKIPRRKAHAFYYKNTVNLKLMFRY